MKTILLCAMIGFAASACASGDGGAGRSRGDWNLGFIHADQFGLTGPGDNAHDFGEESYLPGSAWR